MAKSKIQTILEKAQEKRLELRRYPAYRIVERALRNAFIAAIAAFTDSILSITNTTLWNHFLFAITTGVVTGIDKFRNEIKKAKREYKEKGLKAFLGLFQKDSKEFLKK